MLSLGIGCGLAVLILTRIISIRDDVERKQRGKAACQRLPPNRGFLGLIRILDYLKGGSLETDMDSVGLGNNRDPGPGEGNLCNPRLKL